VALGKWNNALNPKIGEKNLPKVRKEFLTGIGGNSFKGSWGNPNGNFP